MYGSLYASSHNTAHVRNTLPVPPYKAALAHNTVSVLPFGIANT